MHRRILSTNTLTYNLNVMVLNVWGKKRELYKGDMERFSQDFSTPNLAFPTTNDPTQEVVSIKPFFPNTFAEHLFLWELFRCERNCFVVPLALLQSMSLAEIYSGRVPCFKESHLPLQDKVDGWSSHGCPDIQRQTCWESITITKKWCESIYLSLSKHTFRVYPLCSTYSHICGNVCQDN